MDQALAKMVAQAYDETIQDALGQGRPANVAHQEGITAAAMLLAAMSGVEDLQALRQVEALNLQID
jgi:hypothetical protein